jgi:1-deoxy-D-xylulose-5-phosphate reductoisomerase
VSSRTLAILGSTGSIGTQALAVAARHPDRLRVVALAARRDLARLCEQAQRIGPAAVALEEPADGADARAALEAAAPAARLWIGPGAAARMIEEIDAATVLNGIVGAAGLSASMATLARGERLALANKETLVVGGELVARALERGGELLPVDSEHSAVLQCIGGRPPDEVESLTLTASGGALRSHPDWRRATPEEVLAHPVWAMGPRITVDSALLFNKGLELIEARWLFGVPWERLAATLHPQALVHAIVTFRDGSSVLQAAWPDMALPIQLALSWPERWSGSLEPLPPARLAGLEFAPIETGRYPAFDLAVAAGRAGGTAPCVLNAADEVAVEAYLGRAIELGALPGVVAAVLESHPVERVESLEQLARVDEWARRRAREEVMAHR